MAKPTPAKTPTLSPRELEIVRRLLKGELQTSIAGDLEISVSAVQIYVHRAKEKFHCATLIQLGVRFVEGKSAA